MNALYTDEELKELNFNFKASVQISNYTNFYNITVDAGENIRIDDFCIIKGKIALGSNIHIGSHSVIGSKLHKVTIGDNVGISNNASIYTATENFLSSFRGNPTIDDEYRDIISGDVSIGNNCIIGAGVVILPNVKIGNNVSIGANVVISTDIKDNSYILSNNKNKEFIRSL